jgi:mRNA interferase RelE/StbE
MATGAPPPPRRYRVQYLPAARKSLAGLPRVAQQRIIAQVDGLADDPRPPRVRKLVGFADRYRIRVGDYRVIYRIQDDVLLVLILGVDHRRDAYRG